MKATIAALSFLALAIAAFASLVPSGEVPYGMWLAIYLMLAATAIYSWRHSGAPDKPSGWLLLGAAAVMLGALLAAIESLILGPTSGIVMVDVLVVAAAVLLACTGAVYAAIKR